MTECQEGFSMLMDLFHFMPVSLSNDNTSRTCLKRWNLLWSSNLDKSISRIQNGPSETLSRLWRDPLVRSNDALSILCFYVSARRVLLGGKHTYLFDSCVNDGCG